MQKSVVVALVPTCLLTGCDSGSDSPGSSAITSISGNPSNSPVNTLPYPPTNDAPGTAPFYDTMTLNDYEWFIAPT